MPKIAWVNPPFARPGTSFDTFAKVYHELKRRYGYEIAFFVDKSYKRDDDFARIEYVYGFDFSTQLYKILFFLGLPRYWYPGLVKKLEGYDILVTGGAEFNIFGYQSALAAKKFGSKVFLHQSTTFFDYFLFPYTKSIGLWFAKKFCKIAAGFFFTNPGARDAYTNFGLIQKDDARIIILGHPVDSTIFKPIETKKEGKKIVLSVGGLMPVKGHQHIIEAMKDVDGELWIVGKGKFERNLTDLAKKIGVESRVRFLGSKKHEELVELYNKCDVFVLANELEVTPAISEAMLCGKPVVVMRCGGLDFVSDDFKNVVLVEQKDISSLSKNINKLLTDQDFAKELGEKGRKFVLDNFTIEKVAEKMHTAFSSAMHAQ